MTSKTVPALRAELALDQGLTLPDIDLIRIEDSVAAARAALGRAAPGSIFDTDPGHFDRFQIACATGKAP